MTTPPGRPGMNNPQTRQRRIAEAAERARAEAEERRHAAGTSKTRPAPERGGRPGPDPARYGDWEKDGIISDF